jgi:hypothetical protein
MFTNGGNDRKICSKNKNKKKKKEEKIRLPRATVPQLNAWMIFLYFANSNDSYFIYYLKNFLQQ